MKRPSHIRPAAPLVATIVLGTAAAVAIAAAGGQYAYDQPGDKHFVNNTAVLERTSPTGAKVVRPASDGAALIAALGIRPERPRTLLVPLVKRSAIGVVIVRRF